MKNFVGYIRVSTAKQGEHGVSLPEQKDAIGRYADRNGLVISQWFEERVTAAKRGRPIFNQMLKMLRAGKAAGVIIHKIDRSARNLRDWADLIELSDMGVEVQVATETLDLRSRGGRLSADIQAVVAADYIRNLREETRKGFYGRLKQGLYPLPAPIGYVNRGKGRPKEHDPMRATLVRKTFELYATGRYNLNDLVVEINRQGLRNRRGKPITLSGISQLLNNPFYVGLIRLRKTNEIFEGTHAPIISKALFDRVQRILRGKTNTRPITHRFLFRRMLKCQHCGYSLIAEVQKGITYYRCHTAACPVKGVREDVVEGCILLALTPLELTAQELSYFPVLLTQYTQDWMHTMENVKKQLDLQLTQLQDRLGRLTDAYIDRVIDQDLFQERKAALLMERKTFQEQRGALDAPGSSFLDHLREFLELVKSAKNMYGMGFPEEKRDFLKILTSNLQFDGKNVVVELSSPYWHVANRFTLSNCDPYRDIPRTWEVLFPKLVEWAKTTDETVHVQIKELREQCSRVDEEGTSAKPAA